ncbi:MAG: SUMF1/EgtB/PvdO family nonheme iron enzyme [Saprospiraceae bacterium]
MPNPSIFISYRNADAYSEARQLYTDLANRYGEDAVFWDKKRLESGDDWPAELEANVRLAAVLLVLLKDEAKWLGVERLGGRRLDNAGDWVRREIETALADKNKRIVPLLVDGAGLPTEEHLPKEIHELLAKQGRKIATDKWDSDLAALFADLEKHGFQPRPGTSLDPLADYPLPDDVPDPRDHHAAPFLGLRYFDETAARLFFGRTRELLEFFSLVENPEIRLVSLFGHSGVGKSSFLAAGVLPRLRAIGTPHYTRRDKTAARGLATQLDAQRERPKMPGQPPVYILDQVEEMFADPLPGEREAFLQRLRAALQEEPETTLVLGFRSEYLLDLSDLLARVDCRQESLPLRPLGQPALMEAIEGVWRDPVLKNRYHLDLENGFAAFVARNLMHTESGGAAAILQNRLLKLYEQARASRTPANLLARLAIADYDELLRHSTAEKELLDFQVQRLRTEMGIAADDRSLYEALNHFVVDKATAGTLPKSKLPDDTHNLHAALRRVNLLTELPESEALRLSHDLLAPVVRERYQQALLNETERLEIENVRLRLQEIRKQLVNIEFENALEGLKTAALRNVVPNEIWPVAFELAFVFLQAGRRDSGTYALIECANHLDFAEKLRPPFPDITFPDGRDCPALLDFLRRCEPALYIQLKHRYFPTMIPIEGGTFEMGNVLADLGRDNETVHAVTLSGYGLAETPTTWQQYGLYCLTTGTEVPNDSGFGRGERPVINVSWKDAAAYAAWLAKHKGDRYRLPTEAEWEYAARECGKPVRFGNGKNMADRGEMNYGTSEYDLEPYQVIEGEYREKTTSVRLFAPNALGLYDMSGNVWEWCGDWYGEYPKAAQTNPTGPKAGSFRVHRGGSWYHPAFTCRVSTRNYWPPFNWDFAHGFRVASSSL